MIRRATILAGLGLLLANRAWADQPPIPDEPPVVPVPPADKPVDPTPTPTPDPTPVPTIDVTKPAETTGPKPKRVRVMATTLQRNGMTIDLTVAGGVRLLHGEGDQSRWWFGRARAGLLIYNEPNFLILGIAGQLGPLDSSSLGFEAQYIDLWRGTWIQAGVFPLDTAGGVTIEGSVGFTLFGVEYQRRLSGAREGDQTLLISLHVPLGVVRAVRQDPVGVVVLPKATAER